MKEHYVITEKVTLGGMAQAVQIKGTDTDNPLLLVIHGGPGCTEMGVSAVYQRPWEERYTVVNWDQRFVGATALLSGSVPKDDFTLDDIINDAHELCLWLLKRFGKEKLLVMGHSWGSLVGSQLAYRFPELFCGYIGWGQLVNTVKNEQVSMAHTRELATQRTDRKTLRTLDKLLPYPEPHDTDKALVRKVAAATAVKYAYGYGSLRYPGAGKYSRRLRKLAKADPDYPNGAIRYMGNAEAYIHVLYRDVFRFDLLESSPVFRVPVLFVFGDHDWQTPYTLGKEYLERLEAPYKVFRLIKNAGHSTALDNVEDFADFLIHTAYAACIEEPPDHR